MIKQLKFKSFRDFSKGTWNNIQSSLAPANSIRLGLNLDTDSELGSLISRKGTTLIGSQLVDNQNILGLHNYRDSLGSASKLFAAVSDGTNVDIWDVIAGTKSLEDDSNPVSSSISPSTSKSVSPSTSISPSTSLSKSPSASPSASPSLSPSVSPPNSYSPSISLSLSPSASPSLSLSVSPSTSPSTSISPSVSPSISVSISPSKSLSLSPSTSPSISLSASPSKSPSLSPSASLSVSPSVSPPNSFSSSTSPSHSVSPSHSPSSSPSTSPSISRSVSPSVSKSISPSASPSSGSYYGLKTRFLTYLNSCLRLNGVDAPKAYNGSAWVTTGGAFDLDNLPTGAKYAVEFKDRVYVAGNSYNPDRVDISGIADSNTRTISWTSGNRFFLAEQEDGGGGITGLSKVPGYVLIFKKRTMKRYDGSSAYPEDMVNQGAPSQEAITTAQGMCFFMNENGAWATTGGSPKCISTYTVDKIIKSCSAEDLLDVCAGTDEEHIYWSFPSVTINKETFTNVVLKYNISQQTWDIRKYATCHRVYCKYVDTAGSVFTAFGDNDGNVQKLNIGTTDNGTSITYSLETQDIDFAYRLYLKSISRMVVLTDNVSKGSLMWKNSNKVEEWMPLGTIDGEVSDFDQLDLRGNYYNFKITETTDSGQAKILGFEFPIGAIKIYDNSL